MPQRTLLLLSAGLTAFVLVLVGAIGGRLGAQHERSFAPVVPAAPADPVPAARVEPPAAPVEPAEPPPVVDVPAAPAPAPRLDDDDRPDWFAARGQHEDHREHAKRRQHKGDDDD